MHSSQLSTQPLHTGSVTSMTNLQITCNSNTNSGPTLQHIDEELFRESLLQRVKREQTAYFIQLDCFKERRRKTVQ
ncbi:hypothetical protein F2P81_011824 [Scophthalmus maximus]|uniref:Uncharacterized protein n=1 Tax=Scophthalmus maximus TaxID=52904 RepID=A0A6A4T2Q8_SCOMX|nr:hypothetical protein F2P81_011824 [Scophthalmus maximus]